MDSGRHLYRSESLKAVLRVTGSDALTFLQGQFSNDLRLPVGAAVYGLWLNQKGKVQADSHVLRVGEEEFVVISVHSPAEALRQRLESYIVADDVTVSDETGQWAGLLVFGPAAGERMQRLLGVRPAESAFQRLEAGWAYPIRGGVGETFVLVGDEATLRTCKAKLDSAGFIEASAAEAEERRIRAGIPAVPVDLGPADLPQEGGLENVAISFTKGCYLGQEVMARLKNLGQVRRRLHVVRGPGMPPPPAAALFQGGRRVGEIRSSTPTRDGFVALAMLALGNSEPGTALSVGSEADRMIQLEGHE